MFTNVSLRAVHESGWRSGLGNLLRQEGARWWRGGRWLLHAALWLILVNGLLLAFLWAPLAELAEAPSIEQAGSAQIELLDPLTGGVILFLMMGGTATSIGVILVMQSTLIDEKKHGTVGWILSKPVSRTAFIFSKLIVNALAALLLMVVLPSAVAYVLISLRTGSALPVLPFLLGTGLFALHLLFYLTLTLMLGALFEERGPVIGIPLGVLFGAQLLQGFFPWLNPLMPWELLLPGAQAPALAVQIMLSQPLSSAIPIIATLFWILLFVFVTLWKFQREEF